MTNVTHKAPGCCGPRGVHSLVDGDEVWFKKCEHCGERFALIAETVLRESEICVVGRIPAEERRH